MDLLSGSPVCLLILTDPVVLSRVGRVVFFLDFSSLSLSFGSWGLLTAGGKPSPQDLIV